MCNQIDSLQFNSHGGSTALLTKKSDSPGAGVQANPQCRESKAKAKIADVRTRDKTAPFFRDKPND